MTVDELLREARSTLARVRPATLQQRLQAGALVVDIRPVEQRSRFGQIPGSVVVDRNVLEWRLAPSSAWRIPESDRPDLDVVVVCQQGYQSSLAAATLQRLGVGGATDLDGGFEAWLAAGLPVVPAE